MVMRLKNVRKASNISKEDRPKGFGGDRKAPKSFTFEPSQIKSIINERRPSMQKSRTKNIASHGCTLPRPRVVPVPSHLPRRPSSGDILCGSPIGRPKTDRERTFRGDTFGDHSIDNSARSPKEPAQPNRVIIPASPVFVKFWENSELTIRRESARRSRAIGKPWSRPQARNP